MTDIAFADTNIFVRLLTLDEPEQAKAAIDLLQDAQVGKLRLVVNVITIAELVWVLERIYKLERSTVRRNILALQNTPGLEIEHPEWVGQAIDLYVTQNIDFGDALNISWMQAEGITTVYTFDRRHFSRVSGIDVRVPGQDE
jgi:uncharacterized protein